MFSTPSITSSTPRRGPRRSQASAWRRLCLAVCLLARLTAFAASAPAGHEIVNTVNVTYSNLAGTLLGQASASVSTTITGAPALRIVRLVASEPVTMGGPLIYTIEYQNVGSAPAIAVTLTDELSDYVTFVSASDNGVFSTTTRNGNSGGGTITWTLGDLAPGESGIRSVTTRVRTPADYPPGDPTAIFSGAIIPNTATLRSSSLVQALTATVATTVSAGAQLGISIQADKTSGAPGSAVLYTITVSNSGTAPTANAVATAPIPDFSSYVAGSASGNATFDGSTLSWPLGDLAAGASTTLTFTVTISPDAAHQQAITATAQVHDDNTPALQSAPVITTVSGSAQLGISIEADTSTGTPGSAIVYTVTVSNTGTAPAANAVVTAPIPDFSSYLAGSASSNATFDGSALSWPLGDLAAGATSTLTFTVTISPNAVHQQTITASAQVHDDNTPALPSNTVVATVIGENSGLSGKVYDSVSGLPITNVAVWLLKDSASLPAPGTLPADSDKAVLPDTATIKDNPLLLSPDSKGRYDWPLVSNGSYRIWVDTAGTGLSYASKNPKPNGQVHTGSRAEVFTMTNDIVVIDLPLDPPAGQLTMTKEVNTASASIGDIVEYRLTVNASGGPSRDVIVTDTLPKGMEYLAKSSRISRKNTADGDKAATREKADDPAIGTGRALRWPVGDMAEGDSVELRFKVVIGPTVKIGKATNRTFAQGSGSAGMTTSVTATCDIQINAGVFTSQSTIIGKVFHDQNQNGQQDEDEAGIPDVTIYMETGRWAVTDPAGKFSFGHVAPGTHVLRAVLKPLGPDAAVRNPKNAFMGSNSSQIVDITMPGMLYQADFAVSGIAEKTAADKATPTATPAENTSPRAPSPAPAPLSLEEQIENMSCGLAILSPAADSVIAASHTNVLVKAPQGVTVVLSVNGQVIPEKRIGRRITNPKNRVMLLEYIGVDLQRGADNVISVDMLDGFGHVRGNQRLSVRCPGKTAKLAITPEKDGVSADGATLLPIRITVLDSKGMTIPAQGSITIDASAGDIIDKDAAPAEAGMQLPLKDGQATFTLRAPRVSGDVTITAQFDAVEDKKEIFFAPQLSDMIFVGVGELTLGQGSSSKNFFGPRNNSNDWLDDGLYAGGRTAFFAKGKIGDKTLLTAAYDTHKPKQDDFFDENINDADAEDNYPVLGDESRQGNDAQSRDKLYLRLDRGRSSVLYGDFETDFSDTTLARYNRTFTGLKANVDSERLKVATFVAHSDQIQVVDTIPGRGISGLYRLTHGDVVDGSERIVIETRERHRPSVIVKTESKARSTDYEMDYDDGTILFKSPIPSHDSDLNPIYIVVTYETAAAAKENYTYGSRATFAATKAITLGLTAVVEENDTHNESLYGADMSVKLPANSVFKSEIAWSDSLFDTNNQQIARKDSAWLAEIESRPIDGLFLRPYIKNTGDDFSNDSATNTQGGRREVGIDARYDLDDQTAFKAQVLDERDNINDHFYQKSAVGVEKKIRQTQLGMDLSYENSSDGPIAIQQNRPFQSVDRSSFDISDETVQDSLALTVSAETQLWKNLSLMGSHRQELRYDDNNISQVGLRYRFLKTTSLYVKQEWADYADRSESRLVFGAEADVTKNTTAYNEYRVADGKDGAGIQQCIGLRNTWRLSDELSGNISAENASTTSGKERSNQPDAFAVAGSLAYNPNDAIKITSRAEYRDATDETSILGELGAATKLHHDLTWLNRIRYFRDDFQDEGCRVTSRYLTGFAYRPAKHNRFNAISKFEYKHETDDTNAFTTDLDSYIASIELIYQLTQSVQVATKYAGKLIADSQNSYTDLVAARISWDITSRWDAGVGYRVLNSHDVNAISHGGFAEIGYRVVKNLWCGAGYSFDAFDSDLTGESYHGKGIYLKLKLKIDEK